jgi:hypothetical protein
VLGEDTFLLCIDKLDNFSVLTCSLVCKKWNNVATSDVIWNPRFKRHPFATRPEISSTPGNALQKYKAAFVLKQQEKAMEEMRKRLLMRPPRSDRMVCRMFHPSNGRNNFDSISPSVPFDEIPSRDTLIKILIRDNELRLLKSIQDEYWSTEYPSLVTLKVQTQAVNEYGYDDPWIIPSALSYYKDDAEIMGIPHYVKYNRSQQGKIQVGDFVPDLPLTTMKGCSTSLQEQLSLHSSLPIVVVAGSYT